MTVNKNTKHTKKKNPNESGLRSWTPATWLLGWTGQRRRGTQVILSCRGVVFVIVFVFVFVFVFVARQGYYKGSLALFHWQAVANQIEGHHCTHNFGPVQKLAKTIIDFFRWKSITIQLCCYFQFHLHQRELHRQLWKCKIVRSPFEIHANSAINPQKPGILDSLVALLMRSNILHNMHRCRGTRKAEFINWKRVNISMCWLVRVFVAHHNY